MFQIVRCSECGKSGAMPFTLNWNYEDKYCEKCKQTESKYMNYDFCSDKCLAKFTKKLKGHKHKWIKSSTTSYMFICDICKQMKWNFKK